MDSKTYNKDLRKACVEAIFSEFENKGDAIEARRSLGHIVGYVDLDVPDLVDVIIDTIAREAQK